MLLSSTTEILSTTRSPEESVKVLRDAGFKAFDLTLCGENSVRQLSDSEDWREKAVNLRKYANSLGIICNQAHAYFPTSFDDKEKSEKAFNKVVRGIEIAGIIGAKVIVVHPNQHLYYIEGDNDKILKEMNF